MAPQHCYVGLDVSLEQTAVCVLDDAGSVVWQGKCASEPQSVTARPAQARARCGPHRLGDRPALDLGCSMS
jgi:hypothetical protein